MYCKEPSLPLTEFPGSQIHHPKRRIKRTKRYPSCSKSQAGRESEQKWRGTKNESPRDICVCQFWFLMGTLSFSLFGAPLWIHQYKCRHDLKVVDKATGIWHGMHPLNLSRITHFDYNFSFKPIPFSFNTFNKKGADQSANLCEFTMQVHSPCWRDSTLLQGFLLWATRSNWLSGALKWVASSCSSRATDR